MKKTILITLGFKFKKYVKDYLWYKHQSITVYNKIIWFLFGV